MDAKRSLPSFFSTISGGGTGESGFLGLSFLGLSFLGLGFLSSFLADLIFGKIFSFKNTFIKIILYK